MAPSRGWPLLCPPFPPLPRLAVPPLLLLLALLALLSGHKHHDDHAEAMKEMAARAMREAKRKTADRATTTTTTGRSEDEDAPPPEATVAEPPPGPPTTLEETAMVPITDTDADAGADAITAATTTSPPAPHSSGRSSRHHRNGGTARSHTSRHYAAPSPTAQPATADPASAPSFASEPRELRRHRGCGGICLLRQQEHRARKAAAHGGDEGDFDSHSEAAQRAYRALWTAYERDSDANGTDRPLGAPVVDDGSCAAVGGCGVGGACERGQCVCAALFEGERCERANKLLPQEFTVHPEVTADVDALFNSRGGTRPFPIPYRTNPKLGSGESHRFYAQVSTEQKRRLPPSDPTKRMVWPSCAVVGSSGMLRRYRLGKEIDGNSLVIRFNRAPTRRFERHVGRVTHFRFVNTNNANMREHAGEVVVQQMQSNTGFGLYLRSHQLRPYERLFAFDPSFSKFVSAQTKYLPTGGFFAVFFALLKCSEVHLYGFYSQSNAGTEKSAMGAALPHHYYDGEKPSAGGRAIHDYAGERRALATLHRAGLLTIAEPCSWGCDRDTGRACTRCSAGSLCKCGGPPWPVAKPGFCRLHASKATAGSSLEIEAESLCFVPCVGPCARSGLHDGCPPSVERAHRSAGDACAA